MFKACFACWRIATTNTSLHLYAIRFVWSYGYASHGYSLLKFESLFESDIFVVKFRLIYKTVWFVDDTVLFRHGQTICYLTVPRNILF